MYNMVIGIYIFSSNSCTAVIYYTNIEYTYVPICSCRYIEVYELRSIPRNFVMYLDAYNNSYISTHTQTHKHTSQYRTGVCYP